MEYKSYYDPTINLFDKSIHHQIHSCWLPWLP